MITHLIARRTLLAASALALALTSVPAFADQSKYDVYIVGPRDPCPGGAVDVVSIDGGGNRFKVCVADHPGGNFYCTPQSCGTLQFNYGATR